MQETKTSTRVLLVSAIVLLVILITGPLGYKFGIAPLQPSIFSLPIAAVGGLLVFLVGLVFLIFAIKQSRDKDRNQVMIAMIVGIIPFAVVAPQMIAASSVPPIHDITTDTTNPPAFVVLLPQRKEAPNGFEYGNEALSAEELGEKTRTAYPELAPIMSDLSVADAVTRAAATLAELGMEVVSVDDAAGRVEATATTFWFGFKDDVVVRVVADGDGSRLDVRSMSRVGQSDIGANAARIAKFAASF